MNKTTFNDDEARFGVLFGVKVVKVLVFMIFGCSGFRVVVEGFGCRLWGCPVQLQLTEF